MYVYISQKVLSLYMPQGPSYSTQRLSTTIQLGSSGAKACHGSIEVCTFTHHTCIYIVCAYFSHHLLFLLRDERSSLSTVLSAVRELEMAQR